MANALLFSGGNVNCGSPSGLDNLWGSARTMVFLYQGTVPIWTSWVNKTTWDFSEDASGGGGVLECIFGRGDGSDNLFYRIPDSGNTWPANAAGTWYWLFLSIDVTASLHNKVVPYGAAFGGSIAGLGNGARENNTGTGSFMDDSSYDYVLGDGVNDPFSTGMAFHGVLPGAVANAAACEAIIADMAGQSWNLAARLGLAGNNTATDASSNGYTLTCSGTFGTLITDAPDYWTGGAPPTPPPFGLGLLRTPTPAMLNTANRASRW